MSDINEAGGKKTVALIRAAGGDASFFPADVGDKDKVEALVKFAVASYGGLDLAVNNAGIEPDFVPIHELSLAAWEHNVRVNLTGVFLCMKHEIAYMREHGGGSIVNISSVAAERSVAGVHVYAAAKRGVLSLTSYGAVESGPRNIRVNAIMPGAIATRMLQDSENGNPEVVQAFLKGTPLGRFGETDNIAQAALWLSSDAACYYGSLNIFLFDRYVARSMTPSLWWKTAFWSALAVTAIEQVPIYYGLWVYYGEHAFKVGVMPLAMASANAASVMIPSLLVYRLMPMLKGWKQLLVLALVPCTVIGTHAGASVPSYTALGQNTATLPFWILQAGTLLTAGFSLMLIWMGINIVHNRFPEAEAYAVGSGNRGA